MFVLFSFENFFFSNKCKLLTSFKILQFNSFPSPKCLLYSYLLAFLLLDQSEYFYLVRVKFGLRDYGLT
jgi:hypothetical protein